MRQGRSSAFRWFLYALLNALAGTGAMWFLEDGINIVREIIDMEPHPPTPIAVGHRSTLAMTE